MRSTENRISIKPRVVVIEGTQHEPALEFAEFGELLVGQRRAAMCLPYSGARAVRRDKCRPDIPAA